jgi:chromosome segregation ATPase
MEISGKNIKFKYQTEKEINMTDEIIQLNKKIRLLEIQSDYLDSQEPNNFTEIKKVNKQLDELYNKLESLELDLENKNEAVNEAN